jgi:hypothetical protein
MAYFSFDPLFRPLKYPSRNLFENKLNRRVFWIALEASVV